MKIPVIKKLVEQCTLEELMAAEKAISEEAKPAIEVPGDDEGEQLTHAFAAMWIKEKVNEGEDFKKALRAYTQMVRQSID